MTIPEGTPKGLYLYGTVGTGKSMVRSRNPLFARVYLPAGADIRPRNIAHRHQLMDLFHSTLPAQFIDSRRRVHFHAFMIDVHKRNHRYKVQFGETGDRMGEVARDLAREARVLCFDEFQVRVSILVFQSLVSRLTVACALTKILQIRLRPGNGHHRRHDLAQPTRAVDGLRRCLRHDIKVGSTG